MTKQSESRSLRNIPVIDIFAGPGGLSEGFVSSANGRIRFDVRLSVELDPVACETLRLRQFFHLSNKSSARDSYYELMQRKIDKVELRDRHPSVWQEARDRIIQAELGDDANRLDVHDQIRRRIGASDFVLIGGPPCQAYSVIGRSRRLGIGAGIDGALAAHTRKNLKLTSSLTPNTVSIANI